MELLIVNLLTGIIFTEIFLIYPIYGQNNNNDNKLWECNQNDPDFEKCMQNIIPDIMKKYYFDNNKVQRQMSTDAIKFGQFFGKKNDVKYRCRFVSFNGFNNECKVSNYVIDWERYEIKLTTFNPKITIISTYCAYGNLNKVFEPSEGAEVKITMNQVTIQHTINFYISTKGKVYIQDWKPEINPVVVSIDNPEQLGVKQHLINYNQHSKQAFEIIKNGLEKAIGIALRNLSNHKKEVLVPELY